MLFFSVLFIANASSANAQNSDSSYKSDIDDGKMASDTIPCSIPGLFSIHTNMIDWLTATPNIGVEVDLSRYKKQHYSVVLSGKYNPSTSNTINPRWVYNISSVKGEFRKYWRTGNEGVSLDSIGMDTTRNHSIIGRTLSKLSYFRRRYVSGRFIEKPRYWRAYYVGLYGAYDNYSVALGGDGRQGDHVSFGLTFGYSIPLYKRSGYTGWDLDLGISGGLGSHKYRRYSYFDESACYVNDGQHVHNIEPGIHDIHVSLVYRFRSISEKVKYGAERFKLNEERIKEGMERRQHIADSLKQDAEDKAFSKGVEEVLASAKEVLAAYTDTTAYHYVILNDAVQRIEKDLIELKGDNDAEFKRKVYSRELEYYRKRALELSPVTLASDLKTDKKGKKKAKPQEEQSDNSAEAPVESGKKAKKSKKAAKKEEDAPVVEEPKKEEVAPVVEEAKEEEVAPVVEEPKEEEEAPVVEEPKEEEEAPVVEEPKEEEEAPVVEEPKEEEEAPVVEEPKEEEEAPVVEEPKEEEEEAEE